MAVTINGTTGIAGVDGSASTPAVQGTDTNTGIYFPAADTIAFADGGVESMRITSAGEVIVGGTTGATGGIGLTVENVTNPEIALFRNDTTVSSGNLLGAINFYGNDTTSNIPTPFAQISARASGTHGAGDNPTDIVFFTTPDGSATVTEVVRFTQAGYVGIGTSTPTSKLTVSGDVSATDVFVTNGADANAIVGNSVRAYANFYQVGASTGGYISFHTTPSTVGNLAERMRIASTGEFLVGGSTVLPEPYSGGGAPKLNVEGTGGAYLALFRNDTVVASPNPIGDISFYGNDTTSNTPTRLAFIAAHASGTHAAGDNPTDLVFGTTPDGSETVTEAMRITSEGNLEFNSGYGSVATAYGCRAWVNFNGSANTNLSGTYSQSGTTVTVTAAAHGLIAGNVVYSDITSGTGVDGTYTVATVTSSSVFTYTAGTSLTTSGNVTLLRNTIRASGNVSSITDNGTGDYTINFTTSMPDSNYSVVALGNTGSNNGYMTVISTASGNCNIVTRTSAAIGPDGTIICAAVFR